MKPQRLFLPYLIRINTRKTIHYYFAACSYLHLAHFIIASVFTNENQTFPSAHIHSGQFILDLSPPVSANPGHFPPPLHCHVTHWSIVAWLWHQHSVDV